LRLHHPGTLDALTRDTVRSQERPDRLRLRLHQCLRLATGIASLLVGACGSGADSGGSTAFVLEPPRLEASGSLTVEQDSIVLTGTVAMSALPPCDPPSCLFELEYDVVVSQMGTALPARQFSGSVPLAAAGQHSFAIPWDGTRDDPAGVAAPDDVYRADALVAVVKHANGRTTTLATATTVGTSPARFALLEVARFNPCEGCGRNPLSVPVATELVCPLVEGTDLGQPASGDGLGFQGEALIFGDAARGVYQGALPGAASSFVPMLDEPSSFKDAAGNPLPGNDDVLGWLSQPDPPKKSADRCSLGLAFTTKGGSIAPVTMNGPFGDGAGGGTFLGGLGVPGSPFFAGGRLFALMNDAQGTNPAVLLWWLGCTTDSDCPAGDRCVSRPLLGTDGVTAGMLPVCIAHGACPNPSDPASPCFLRARPRRLGVSVPASPEAFVTPGVDTVTDAAVAAPYPNTFALTSAFVDAGPPAVVYVFGRESLDGVRGTWSSAVHLLRHRLDDLGRLEPPEIFAGCRSAGIDARTDAGTGPACGDAEPIFTRGAEPATLYDEEKAIVTNTRSVVFVPGIGADGRGLYLMVYGGRRPTSFLGGPARLAQPTLTGEAIGDELSGIYVRTAPHPWGPWSAAKTLFSPFSTVNDGYCHSMHYDAHGPAENPRFSCASDAEAANAALARNPVAPTDSGAEYGAGIVPSLVRVVAGNAGESIAVFDWLLSTWNPYGVVMMRTQLGFANTSAGLPPSPRTDGAVTATLNALRAARPARR
jgi:hypothetical protein